MYCYYVYYGRKRGAIFGDNFDHAKQKFEAANPGLQVKKVRNAHDGEMKMYEVKK